MNKKLQVIGILASTFISIAILYFFPPNVFFFYLTVGFSSVSILSYQRSHKFDGKMLTALVFALLIGIYLTDFPASEPAAIFSVEKNQGDGSWSELKSPVRLPELNTSFICYTRNVFSLEQNEISFNISTLSTIQCDVITVNAYLDDDKMINSAAKDDHIFLKELSLTIGEKIIYNGEPMWEYKDILKLPVSSKDIDPLYIHLEFFFHFSSQDELFQGKFLVDITFEETEIEREGSFSSTNVVDPDFSKVMETSIGRLMVYAMIIFMLYGILLVLSIFIHGSKPLIKMQIIYSMFSVFLLIAVIISVPQEYADFLQSLYTWCDDKIWFSKDIRNIGYIISDVIVYVIAIASWVATCGLTVFLMGKISIEVFGQEISGEIFGEMIDS